MNRPLNPPAPADADHIHCLISRPSLHLDGIGMQGGSIRNGFETEVDALFLSQIERSSDASIIGFHALQTRHDGPVGSMALVGARETIVKGNGSALRRGAEQSVDYHANANNTGCMRAGGTYHNGTDHVKNAGPRGHGYKFRGCAGHSNDWKGNVGQGNAKYPLFMEQGAPEGFEPLSPK